ncbi:hypothetical protein JR316_0004431 [Psilocybe cubensis]|uniref:Uncharacterized protein n=2 Tax=Psilocybe cubensis TaxID=181762 RepID=A0ACB8H342_PSICU|nr:hypothetical protein JR316_0004431 [Psilocybe cubensis]KAH9482333.1 hypothetical protein JR316_0004431 [Psilocybe cubensis]
MSYPKSNHPNSPSFDSSTYTSTSKSSRSATSPRKTHRKRASTSKLSSDTTSTLPEYFSVPTRGAAATTGWQPNSGHSQQILYPTQRHLHSFSGSRLGVGVGEEEEDKPPDYPDSAEEADEDTDTDVNAANIVYVPVASPSQRPQAVSPRRNKRFLPSHKRRQSVSSFQQFQQQQQQELESSDPYLDSLLERSVHALEMSNTLLQSSISTKSSLSTILGADTSGDGALEARALGLSHRIRETWDARAAWADDLEEISRNVEGLFIEENNSSPSSRRYTSRSNIDSSTAMRKGGVSCSLPSGGGYMSSMRRRPSLDLRLQSDSAAAPRLHYTLQSRSNLVSPPPRALTQYVASTEDTESIFLPSTIGLRSSPSVHPTPDSSWKPLSDVASSSTTSLLSTQSFSSLAPSKLADKPLEPSTPAYNMLSSFVFRPTPPGSATPSFVSRRRDSSIASGSTERERRSRRSSKSPVSQNRGTVSPIRQLTPPVEEASSSSSSSDGFLAKRTVQSLRKILDDQPPPPPPVSNKLKSPAFMPRTPAPAAEAETSTATASISRLFTKGKHSSSTRSASPPRQSAMKQRHRGAVASPNGDANPSASALPSAVHTPSLSLSVSTSNTHTAATPSPLPSPSPMSASGSGVVQTLSIPDLVSKVLKARSGLGSRGSITDADSSGQSTPSKRISFAELPESYASTRPPSSRFSKGNKSSSRRRKSSGAGSSGKGDDDAGDVSPGSWWSGWLGGGMGGSAGVHGLGVSLARQEERMEDRMTRNWGGRINSGYGGGGLDDWAVSPPKTRSHTVEYE